MKGFSSLLRASFLEFLRDRLPHLLPVYSSLATETVRLAVRSGKIDGEQAREVLDVVHAILLPSIDEDLGQ